MLGEIGQILLLAALATVAVQASLPLLGAWRGNTALMAIGRSAAFVHLALALAAFVVLSLAFVRFDFSLRYVADNANLALPLAYRLSAVWGAHEGSLLLWLLVQASWSAAVAWRCAHLPQRFLARVLGVLGIVGLGFALFCALTSNPFARLLPAALDGNDLNPLLQDPGLIFHPPLLYLGYVGFSVPFAFAVAALLEGRVDSLWLRASRPWTNTAWALLTGGIALGSWWAYYELGWGGWWFWDPVENASFMPWLVGTALVHSLAVTEKRGSFKSWTVLLAILAFSLSLLGTFLVRSGVLSSVHAFATDPRRGLFILAFLVVVIGSSLTLYAWRAPTVGLGARFALLSRETLLLLNNVLLVAATGAVLLGTLYPLVLDALGLGKISVGPPYFDTVFVPLMAPLVFLMGVGPIARWKQATLPDLWTRLRWALGVAIVAAIAVEWATGEIGALATLGLALAFWIIAATFTDLAERVRGGNVVERLKLIPRAMVGMMVAHVGIAVFIIGVTMVKGHEVERDVKMDVGDSTTVRDVTFTFKGVSEVQGPNYVAARGSIEVSRDGRVLREMNPEKRMYRVQTNPMTEAAIATGLTGDLYVSLGEPVEGSNGAWIVRVYVKPFVDWIWGGCLLMAFGGLLAASDRRYRAKVKSEQTVSAAVGAGA